MMVPDWMKAPDWQRIAGTGSISREGVVVNMRGEGGARCTRLLAPDLLAGGA